MSKFINAELKSDSDSELDSDLDSNLKIGSKFDAELMAKLESGPDSEKNNYHKWLQIKVIVTNDYK